MQAFALKSKSFLRLFYSVPGEIQFIHQFIIFNDESYWEQKGNLGNKNINKAIEIEIHTWYIIIRR